MNDIKLTVKRENKIIKVKVDDLFFSVKLTSKNMERISNTSKLDKKVDSLSQKADKFLYENKQDECLNLRKKAVKIATNHVLGSLAFSHLYKKYKDLAIVETIVRSINQSLIQICLDIVKSKEMN